MILHAFKSTVSTVRKIPIHPAGLLYRSTTRTSTFSAKRPLPRISPAKWIPPAKYSRADREPLRHLLSIIRSFVGTAQDLRLVNGFVHKQLSEYLPLIPDPQMAYEKVISFLVNNHFLKEATNVYQRMVRTGFKPSSDTKTQMLVVKLARSEIGVEAFDPIVSKPAYSEDRLLDLLQLIVKLGISYENVSYIAARFVEVHSEGYSSSQALTTKLVDDQVRAGRLEDAFETIIQNTDSTPPSRAMSPYAKLIAALNDTQASSDKLFKTALQLTKKSRVDIVTFNALISQMLHERSFSQVFSLYHVVKKLSDATLLTPDASTFRLLFSTLTRLRPSDVRTWRLRQYKPSIHYIPPRRVFHDLITYHSHKPLEISSAILNTIMRTFIVHRDYPGALIVLYSFTVFGVDITVSTYRIIMRHIMYRVRKDTISAQEWGKSKWGDRFLKARINDPPALITNQLAENILAFVTSRAFDYDADFCSMPPDGPARYIAPTLDVINGEVPVLQFMRFHKKPLSRLLHRAVVADGRILGGDQKYISVAMAKAQAEMNFNIQPRKSSKASSEQPEVSWHDLPALLSAQERK